MNIDISPVIVINKDSPTEMDLSDAIVEVADNKLVLSKDAINTLSAKPKDKIAINYWTVNCENTFPLIGRAEWFGSDEGNKLTKSNTVSFRGEQNKVLREYGTVFKMERFKDYFKLVPKV